MGFLVAVTRKRPRSEVLYDRGVPERSAQDRTTSDRSEARAGLEHAA